MKQQLAELKRLQQIQIRFFDAQQPEQPSPRQIVVQKPEYPVSLQADFQYPFIRTNPFYSLLKWRDPLLNQQLNRFANEDVRLSDSAYLLSDGPVDVSFELF